jgi:hypothetical protein
MDQVSIKYRYQHLPLQDPTKFTHIWSFGLKTNHLATLQRSSPQKKTSHKSHCVRNEVEVQFVSTKLEKEAGLPDFSWSKHTKMGRIYQMTANFTKRP